MTRSHSEISFVDDACILFVDADGTLYSTDILHESLIRCLTSSPLHLFRMPFWLLKGRAFFKSRVAALVEIDAGTLPYREDVIDVLRMEALKGRTLVLATAAHDTYARAIAAQLGFFRDVIATDGQSNLKGIAKVQAITAYCSTLDQSTFSYMGDAHTDLVVWQKARAIYAVAPSWRLRTQIRTLNKPTQFLGVRHGRVRAFLAALRPQQWAKNLLIYAPLLTSHRALEADLLARSSLAFVAFSLTASAVYVANDLLDLTSDRAHPKKRHRPFAAGHLPVAAGPALIVGLLTLGLLITTRVSPTFTIAVMIYLAMNVAYSFWLKRKLLADVVALSLMYAIRIVSGGEATGIVISEWLLAFSLFLFTSLALVKRHAELVSLDPHGPSPHLSGRAYRFGDLRIVEGLGTSSGLLAVLVLALYIASPEVKLLYSAPQFLWLLCPLLYFWVARVWILSGRAQLHHDPVVFAMTDWRSLATWCVGALILLLATFA